MAFDGLRNKLRSLASSGSDSVREASQEAREIAPERVREARARAGAIADRRAPATGLEGQQKPRPPTSRERIARRLRGSGQMRKPVQDATLEPAADPRFMEAFGRGDAAVRSYFGESSGDPFMTRAAAGENTVMFGSFTEEMIDERDHEGGLYANRDERESGMLDDGIDVDDILGGRF